MSKAWFIGIAAVFVFQVAASGDIPHKLNYQAYLTKDGSVPSTGALSQSRRAGAAPTNRAASR